MSTTILIPAADIKSDSFAYIEQLLLSIERGKIDPHYEIVVMFDGCHEEFVDKVFDRFPFVRFDQRFINLSKQKNFCGNVNAGLRILHGQEGKNVIVVNQDCILPSVAYFKRIEYGDLTSATELVLAQELEQIDGLNQVLEDCQDKEPTYTRVEKIIGFCMYLSSSLMDRVGYLNEYLQASFDDDDLSAKANLLDIPIYQSNVAVNHFQGKLGAYSGIDLPVRKNQFNILWQIPLTVPHDQFQKWIKDNCTWQESFKDG